MNRSKTIQQVVERIRKQIAEDLPKDLVAAIIEIQAAPGAAEDPKACDRAISELLQQHELRQQHLDTE